MKLKPGVKLHGLSPQMALAAVIVEGCYASFGATCTITSANDSTHKAGSLHYDGNALDFRTKDFAGNKGQLAMMIKERLGSEFDVVVESMDTPNEHIHVEWDPA